MTKPDIAPTRRQRKRRRSSSYRWDFWNSAALVITTVLTMGLIAELLG